MTFYLDVLLQSTPSSTTESYLFVLAMAHLSITDEDIDNFLDHHGYDSSLYIAAVIALTIAFILVCLLAIVIANTGWFSFVEKYHCSTTIG
jgi:hypothetical protein